MEDFEKNQENQNIIKFKILYKRLSLSFLIIYQYFNNK